MFHAYWIKVSLKRKIFLGKIFLGFCLAFSSFFPFNFRLISCRSNWKLFGDLVIKKGTITVDTQHQFNINKKFKQSQASFKNVYSMFNLEPAYNGSFIDLKVSLLCKYKKKNNYWLSSNSLFRNLCFNGLHRDIRTLSNTSDGRFLNNRSQLLAINNLTTNLPII